MQWHQISLISHADWSANSNKRWIAVSVLLPDGSWSICELSNVRQPSELFLHLQSLQQVPGCIISGFDFPIGLPYRFALKAGITDFLSFLPSIGRPNWDEFYLPAVLPSEISLHRPFYPAKPGASSRTHLENGLGIPFNQLYRLCEVRQLNRHAACPLFWTLGSQQVGKAAISGWRDLLTPALSDPSIDIRIWPFSGLLAELSQPPTTIVVETYPAEFYSHLGLSFSFPVKRSKRRWSDRLGYATQLLSWASAHNLILVPSIKQMLLAGFSIAPDGEDRFDAFIGLYGMINVIQGNHPTGEPFHPYISKVEGWIFGQEGSKAEFDEGGSI